MTLSSDEPLTRRQLRDLERQMPRKERADVAQAAEESDAARKSAADEPVAESPVVEAAVLETAEVAQIIDAPAQDEQVYEHIVEEKTIDDVPVDDDPDDGEPVTAETVDSASVGPILSPLFSPPVDRPDSHIVLDESSRSFDDLISARPVGANNAYATSALVLPAVPSSMDIGSALDETGEVIITGSINLPPSMGANGAPAEGIESSELDALLDFHEYENLDGDVAPVSASRAVSTTGGSSGTMVTPPKRGRANVPVILAITAGVLAIGVVGLLLAAFVFRIF
jgi:hypothetical protein